MDNCTKYQHKAIIETLKIFEIRNSELRSMKIKVVKNNDEENIKIAVDQCKTISRKVIYEGRANYLLTWVEKIITKKETIQKALYLVLVLKSHLKNKR